ncbi:hypothetical protein KAR91_60160 [Candidatus Pacearchaeota archaeon]|nr:hypothetical protein [Candidatus Pacearchaeota archaeon]
MSENNKKTKPCPACGSPLKLPTQFLDAMGEMKIHTDSFIPAFEADFKSQIPIEAIKGALWWLNDGLDNADMSNREWKKTADFKNQIKDWIKALGDE